MNEPSPDLEIAAEAVEMDGVYHLIDSVVNTCAELDVPILLIGALARDLVLVHKYEITPPRATRDVDVAVAVSDWTAYAAVKKHLLDRHGFTAHGQEQRLIAPSETPLDLVPFGDVADADGTAGFPPDGTPAMTVLGFAEVYDAALTVHLEKGPVFNVASLEGIGLLKLIAWNDRPHERKKDARDLCFLMREYYDLETTRVVDTHSDLFDDPDFDKDIASARVYGREVSDLAYGGNPKVLDLCRCILRQQTNDPANSLLVRHMGRSCFPLYDRRFQMLSGFQQGMLDRLERT